MDKFNLDNQVERVMRGDNTYFLNPIESKYVLNRIKKRVSNYRVLKLFEDSEKFIIYKDNLDVSLFEIKTNSNLTHREILGALLSHNLSDNFFGDIIIDDDRYFVAVLNTIKDYMINNFIKIGNKKVQLLEVNLSTIKDYQPDFLDISLSISSLRLDNIISKLIPTSRSVSGDFIKDKKVVVNYNLCTNKDYTLKDGDIFSIRGIGKFKYIGINYLKSNSKKSIIIKKYV